MMGQKIRYERPLLIDMSIQSATGGATVCSSGTNRVNCNSGSCVGVATCNYGDYPTNCSAVGNNTYVGNCSFCGVGYGVGGGYDTLYCKTGGTAAAYCIQGAVAGKQCSGGQTVVPCTC